MGCFFTKYSVVSEQREIPYAHALPEAQIISVLPYVEQPPKRQTTSVNRPINQSNRWTINHYINDELVRQNHL
jgi:hypothetical protein